MAKVVKKNGQVFWVDEDGNQVPVKHIKKIDRERDRVVERTIKIGKDIEKRVTLAKKEIVRAIDGFIELVKKENGLKSQWKGNITLYDFAKEFKVNIGISEKLMFNEQLQVAKSLIDECIKEWAKSSNEKIVLLINQAFKVDKQGKVDTNRILSLRQLDIKDAKWQQAMEKISEAITIDSSKRYFVFEEKQQDGSYKNIQLNFSAV
mgnify:CR=1 FL=1